MRVDQITSTMVARSALPILKRLKARDVAYEEECRQWSREGYAPHYCIHGTNRWTDYDNICGPCEDGLTNYEIALRLSRDAWVTFVQRMAYINNGDHYRSMPDELRSALIEWAAEPMAGIK